MCSRVTNHQELDVNARDFDADIEPGAVWTPSYNIAPTQQMPVLGAREGRRVLRTLRWGLVPSWVRDAEGAAEIAPRCINARSETVDVKPAFKAAFVKRRCAVLVSGWYEWKHEGTAKIPHWFHGARGELLALAGLWERWKNPATGEELRTVTVLTTEPNAKASSIHDRMPVVLGGDALVRWLAPDTEVTSLRYLLRPCADETLDVYVVDRKVGSPRNNDQGLIVRAA
jgi:putative SOS response-associated peptidase YedK